jgi:hypothetical protein
MKICPKCNTAYDDAYDYCRADGARTVQQDPSTTEHPTQALRPPLTALTTKRVGDLQTTQPVVLEHLKLSVRLDVEADHAEDPNQANEKRWASAFGIAEAIHEALLRRLQSAKETLNNKSRWLSLLPPKPPKGKDTRSFGQQRLEVYLKSNAQPTLSVIGGWFSRVHRLQPEELAVELEARLGVPAGYGDSLLKAGDLRNVLAHRADYLVDVHLDLGNAADCLQVVRDGAFPRIYVPSATVDWLEKLCGLILAKKKLKPAPKTATEKICLTCMRTYTTEIQTCTFDGTQLDLAENESLIGKMVDGRYKIIRAIGYGGMGRVYQAQHLENKQYFALKFLLGDLTQNPEMVKRFQREIRTAQTLNHPHCVKVTDSGRTSKGLFYLAMEYLEGNDLSQLVSGRALPYKRAAKIAKQICEGLSEVHKQGMIHRDIKPTNIILIENGTDPDFVKILDFGIAKLLHPNPGEKTTKLDIVYGTPAYMSPEQARGDGLDGRSDLYSLGILLFQMVTGHLPFFAKEQMELLLLQITKQPPAPRTLVPSLPASLESVILRALEKNRDARFADANSMALALKAFCV